MAFVAARRADRRRFRVRPAAHKTTGRRVIVLGVRRHGLRPDRELMARGRLPNFPRLASTAAFAPLGTSIPPQSPVAWSTFITGLDPGGHGIFDFVHRDPKTMQPYLSTTRTEPAARTLKLGKWQFPLERGRVELLRDGQPFWDVLEQHGVETTIVRMPANFPPSGTATRELSGMGTPDCSAPTAPSRFSRSRAGASTAGSLSGGAIYPVAARRRRRARRAGRTDNPFLVEPREGARRNSRRTSTRPTALREARRRRRGAAAAGRRVERLGSGRVRADAVAEPARRSAAST